jgi:hypothetical protein
VVFRAAFVFLSVSSDSKMIEDEQRLELYHSEVCTIVRVSILERPKAER